MREKVAWANERGLTPPTHAVRLAEQETPNAGSEEKCSPFEPIAKCCSTKHGPGHQESINGSKNTPHDVHVGWVAGLFAQKCHGQGGGTLGLLNIGVPPAYQQVWLSELEFVDICNSINQVPIHVATLPLLPPPKI